MADPARVPERMSLAEFLAWDDGTDTRHELYDGRVVAMSPPAAAHARLLTAVVVALDRRMRSGCGVFTGGGVGVVRPGDRWNYRVPDVMVSCAESRQQWVDAPTLLVEVLSPSTKRVDAREKLAFYGDIASVQEIVLIWPDQRRVDLWQREPDSWTVRTYIGSSALPLRATTEPVPLDELYEPLGL